MKVTQMQSDRGNYIPNQIEIEHNGKVYFQSYDSIIALKDGDTIYLDKKLWNFSKTTSKYRNKFTGLTTQETKAKIENGEIKLIDLNVGNKKAAKL